MKFLYSENQTSRHITNSNDMWNRYYKIKNFLKMLPVYEELYDRKIFGIDFNM
jgi:hypothetical protein